MRILINFTLVLILILVWGFFYKKNISPKDISKKSKFFIILIIIFFNLASLYIFNLSSKKNYISEFKGIEISLQLGSIENYLTDNKSNYQELMKKDTVDIASKLLLKNKFNYNPKAKNGIKIIFSDSISYKDKKKVYLVKVHFLYSMNNQAQELETYLIIKNPEISYKKLISSYQNILNELLSSISFKKSLKSKKLEELVSILTYRHNLPDIYYIHIFNKLLESDVQPLLPDHVLLRFLELPSTFSEATGYAILTNHCSVINKIIDKSIYFNSQALDTLLSILVQSSCQVVEGYLSVLTSSQNQELVELAKKYLKEQKKNFQKEIIYKDGKRVKP